MKTNLLTKIIPFVAVLTTTPLQATSYNGLPMENRYNPSIPTMNEPRSGIIRPRDLQYSFPPIDRVRDVPQKLNTSDYEGNNATNPDSLEWSSLKGSSLLAKLEEDHHMPETITMQYDKSFQKVNVESFATLKDLDVDNQLATGDKHAFEMRKEISADSNKDVLAYQLPIYTLVKHDVPPVYANRLKVFDYRAITYLYENGPIDPTIANNLQRLKARDIVWLVNIGLGKQSELINQYAYEKAENLQMLIDQNIPASYANPVRPFIETENPKHNVLQLSQYYRKNIPLMEIVEKWSGK